MHTFGSLFLLLAVGQSASLAQNTPESDFKKLTLEELMDINVNAVTRTEEPLGPSTGESRCDSSLLWRERIYCNRFANSGSQCSPR